MRKIITFLLLCVLLLTMCSCKNANDGEEIITVNYNAKIEESLFRIPFKYELSESMIEKGFLSIEKKGDGLAVYTIKRKDYEKFISQFAASKKEILDECSTDFAPYVKSVSYNDNLTEIVISVSKTDYENVSFSNGYLKIQNCIIGCSNNVGMYHSFSTGDFVECEIKVIDSATGDILNKIYSPSSLLNN